MSNIGYKALKAAKNSIDMINQTIENFSNVKSLGYKKKEVSFIETLNGEIERVEGADHSQGTLRRTGDIYDVALEGPGYFEVELDNGQIAYTRVGRFKLNSDGELVTEDGYRVLPQVESSTKPIIKPSSSENNELGLNFKVETPKLLIPPDLATEIKEDGTVNGINTDTNEKVKLGKINLVVFNNPNGLKPIGKGYYLKTDSSGQSIETEAGFGAATKVKQGFVEFSNVSVAQEMMNLSQMKSLIAAQFKVLKVLDRIHENINYTVGRSA